MDLQYILCPNMYLDTFDPNSYQATKQREIKIKQGGKKKDYHATSSITVGADDSNILSALEREDSLILEQYK